MGFFKFKHPKCIALINVFLKKLVAVQLNSPVSVQPRDILSRSRQPAACLYPEPDESRSHTQAKFPYDAFKYYTSIHT
jgi:hypothetical protein